MVSRPVLSLLSVAALAAMGCGGGSSSSSSPSSRGGTAKVVVRWPVRGRLVPLAANSVRIRLTLGSLVAERTVPRPPDGTPESAVRFTGLPYGSFGVSVAAFPTTDGTGVAQSTGLGTVDVVETVERSVEVATASTVASLTAMPAAVSFDKGTQATVTVGATDASGAIVLLTAGGGEETLTWTIDDPSKASIAGVGPTVVLTGLRSGSTTIRASLRVDDAGAVAEADAPVVVRPLDDGTGTVIFK